MTTRFRTLLLAVLAFALAVIARGTRADVRPSPAPSSSSAPAAAAPPRRPVVALATSDGDRGPLDLAPKDGAYTGTFTVTNAGGEPLVVSRVAIRGDDDDVRAPPRVSARFAEGLASSATIPPGASRAVVVTWAPPRDARVRQAFAHVVVTSNDEEAGEVAMGVRARASWPPAFVFDHLLTWLTFAPLAGAALLVLLLVARRADEGVARRIALGATGAQLVLAVLAAATFRGDVTHLDGNDGLQLVERAVWLRSLGVEYFVGIDGVSAPMLLVTALLGFVACVASEGLEERATPAYYALLLALLGALAGTFVAEDLFLFFVLWSAALVPAYLLIAAWGGPRRERASIEAMLFGLAGCALLFLAFAALHASSDRTFLVDGTSAPRAWAIPELARVSFAGKRLVLFGLPFVKVVWLASFLGFAVRFASFPVHTWLAGAVEEAPAPVALLLAGVFVEAGVYGLLRVTVQILPEATRWAAGGLVGLGAVTAVYGALCAMAQDDAKRMVGYVTTSQMGFALVGLGSLTPQGITASVVQLVTQALIASMLLLVAQSLEERAGERRWSAFGGLAREAPAFGALVAIALLASLGAPGLAGFWGQALAVLGAFASTRGLACVAACALVVSAATHVRAMRRLLFGELPAALRAGPRLDAFGGRFPDVSAREIATIVPLAVVVVLLGVWPVPLLAIVAGGVRDVTWLVSPPGPDQIAILAGVPSP